MDESGPRGAATKHGAISGPEPKLPEGTSAEKWIASITSLSDPEEARRLGQRSGVEKTRISDLQKQLTDVHSADPRKTAQALQLKATRIERLLHLLQRAEYFLGDSTIREVLVVHRLDVKSKKATLVLFEMIRDGEGQLTDLARMNPEGEAGVGGDEEASAESPLLDAFVAGFLLGKVDKGRKKRGKRR